MQCLFVVCYVVMCMIRTYLSVMWYVSTESK